MIGSLQKQKIRKDPEFLRWAKRHGGICCVCRWLHGLTVPFEELHHHGDKGTGQRGDDYFVARMCKTHHREYQGKRGIGFDRAGEWEVAAAIRRDNSELLADYIEHLKRSKR